MMYEFWLKINVLILVLLFTPTTVCAVTEVSSPPSTADANQFPEALLSIQITNIKNQDGVLRVSLFNDASAWLSKTIMNTTIEVGGEKCSDGICAWTVTAPYGVYGVAVYHDENNNGVIDTNFLGIPNEDYGFSNNVSGFMGAPNWSKASFAIAERSTTQHITLQ